MNVRTLQVITTPRGEIPAGEILTISAHLAEKLKGKVEKIVFRGAVEIVTPEGEQVWIATDPEAVELIPTGAVYFLGSEIMLLQKAGREAARVALNVKKIFGNDAIVEDIDQYTN